MTGVKPGHPYRSEPAMGRRSILLPGRSASRSTARPASLVPGGGERPLLFPPDIHLLCLGIPVRLRNSSVAGGGRNGAEPALALPRVAMGFRPQSPGGSPGHDFRRVLFVDYNRQGQAFRIDVRSGVGCGGEFHSL